ncbi:SMODS domain-containing nucleotidyltransferase [Rhodomicrobium sp.]|uniref:SMODS domain-containing nucleotidyltransferase n=1 Tax=Rhodomicrobium sp. TaxID=2720632 RepID=UPI0039E21C32
MKLVGDFRDFLSDTVNLNQTRLDRLEDRITAIKTFIRDADWEPRISAFIEQGSWAHGTIIKPVDGGEFDADLLVKVHPIVGWSAAQYVRELGRAFLDSNRYGDKTVVYDYCVTITYADDCKIDIAPLVMDRDQQGALEVCNKRKDEFEDSQPVEYTRWMREKNGYSGNNSFRKATRLIKYIRDIKKRFSCQSVLLTTLIGHRIEWWDKDSGAFADTPTALSRGRGRKTVKDYRAQPSAVAETRYERSRVARLALKVMRTVVDLRSHGSKIFVPRVGAHCRLLR